MTSPRPSEGTRVTDPPAYAITRYIVGGALFFVDLYKIATEPTADWKERAFHGALMVVAICILPGVASGLAAGLNKIAPAIAKLPIPGIRKDPPASGGTP